MDQFIILFLDNFELCCSAVLAVCTVISLIVATFRKTKFFRLKDFVSYLSTLCSLAESLLGGGSTGQSKFDIVFREAVRYSVENHLGLSDDDLKKMIESILSAPQKSDR